MQSAPVETPAQAVVTRSVRSLRMWPLVALVALFWLFGFVTDQLEMPYFVRFLSRMAAPALVALLFFIWWWASRRIGFVEKLFGFAVVIGTGAAAMPFWHESVGGWFGLFLNLPIVLTAWTLWLLAVKKLPVSWYRPGLVVVMVLSWGYFGLVTETARAASRVVDRASRLPARSRSVSAPAPAIGRAFFCRFRGSVRSV